MPARAFILSNSSFMKSRISSLLLGLAATAATASAGTSSGQPVASTPGASASTRDTLQSSACCVAPSGVMFDHQMPAGTWMFGARYMFQRSQGIQLGSDQVDAARVYDTEASPGSLYHAAPVKMDMQMTMLEAMWAPTDLLTFMVMSQHNSMTMGMQHGGHGGEESTEHHGAPSHGSGHLDGSYHEHTIEGWGDTNLTAAIRLHQDEVHHLHVTAGFSAPTGSVSKRGEDGRYTHYMMQPGSGTWDGIAGLTYTGHEGGLFWGAQYLAQVRLEDEGESGFRFGDVHSTTAWLGAQVNTWAAMTGRVNWRHEGLMHGHYKTAHNHGSPSDLTRNYGGDIVELGLGLNTQLAPGHQLALEALWPIYQDAVGFQPRRDFSLVVSYKLSL
jgi:hypothetical protein